MQVHAYVGPIYVIAPKGTISDIHSCYLAPVRSESPEHQKMTGPIKRVMIVDSYPVERRGIRAILEQTRYQVVSEASDGLAAAALARREAPDIAILDYDLPGLNGLETAALLREALPPLEVVMFSRPMGDHVIASFFQAGIHGYVSKSDPCSALVRALDALSLRRAYCSTWDHDTMRRVLAGKEIGPSGLLSRREFEVLRLIAGGRISSQIALQLKISRKTVETHRNKIKQKAHCNGTARLVAYAVRNNVIAL